MLMSLSFIIMDISKIGASGSKSFLEQKGRKENGFVEFRCVSSAVEEW